jgi:hypothetical protein
MQEGYSISTVNKCPITNVLFGLRFQSGYLFDLISYVLVLLSQLTTGEQILDAD